MPSRGDRFFGFFGRRKSVSPTQTAGDSGTPIFGGFPVEAERSSALVGRQKFVTYSDLLANTTIIAASVRLFLNLLAKAKWTAVPADANVAAAVQAAELFESVMAETETPWHRVVRRAAMYRFHGFSIQEWTAVRREDGRIGMLDVEPRPQVTIERWDCDNPRGKLQGIVQRSPQTQEELYIPRTKFIYIVDDALNDSPEGLGVFRHAVDANKRLKRFELLEAYGFETDLRGIPIGRAPLAILREKVQNGQMSPEEVGKVLDALTKFLKSHIKNPQLALMLDSTPYRGTGDQQTPSSTPQWDVDLLQGEGNGAEPVNIAIERINREIARLLGTEFMMLGSTGSQALSRDKTSTFNLTVESSLDEVRETYVRDFLPIIMDLNGIPRELWPTIATETVQFRDVEQITQGLKDVQAAMLTPGDPAINEVREILGLSPVPEELEELLLEERQAMTRATINSVNEDPDDDGGDDDG